VDYRILNEYDEVMVAGLPLKDAVEKIEWFHGSLAPGLLLGGFMVDVARELLPESVLYNAVVESPYCLPDAVQLFTPCTVGNSWLQLVDYGRFALTLYDKDTGLGVRVWADVSKMDAHPKIRDWFLKRVPKKDLPLETLIPAILTAGRSIFSSKPVRVSETIGVGKKGNVRLCPNCGESYPEKHGALCRPCSSGGYYQETHGS